MNVTETLVDNAAHTLKVADESQFEYWSDFLIGSAFLLITLLAAGR